ncbi:UNVERIFIED_CONTAM: hypothetical protein Slati_3762800, partial [Sesamum latifolium]
CPFGLGRDMLEITIGNGGLALNGVAADRGRCRCWPKLNAFTMFASARLPRSRRRLDLVIPSGRDSRSKRCISLLRCVVSYCVALRHVLLRCITSRRVLSHYVMLRCIASRCVLSHFFVLLPSKLQVEASCFDLNLLTQQRSLLSPPYFLLS